MRIDSRCGQSDLPVRYLLFASNAFNESPPLGGLDQMCHLPFLAKHRIQRPQQLGLRRQERGGRGTSAAPVVLPQASSEIIRLEHTRQQLMP